MIKNKKPIKDIKQYPRLIEKVYEYKGVKVGVRIDFRNREISLTDSDGIGNKKYLFAHRGVQYMAGWRIVLEAMEYAITDAEATLREYVEVVEQKKIALHVEIDKLGNSKYKNI